MGEFRIWLWTRKTLIVRFRLFSRGTANGSLKLTLRGTHVACVAKLDDIKDINQGTYLQRVISKQLGGQIENI